MVGPRDIAIMTRHILPNILGPIVVVATLGVATAIIVGASLSFLGLGAQPPTPEWGAMLSEGREFIQTGWWMSVSSRVAIMIIGALDQPGRRRPARPAPDPRSGT